MTPRDITEHAAHIMGYLGALKPEDRLAVWANVMGQMWQPIENAPKDVPVLLGWEATQWAGGKWEVVVDLYASTRGRWRHGTATHWQPLPTAPAKDTP